MTTDNMDTESNASSTRRISPDQVLGMIDQLHETVANFEGRLQAKSIKTRPPEPFDGTRSKLRGFLTQLELYMQVNREKLGYEADKVLFTTTYLTGPAFNWFEPIVRDYQENVTERQDDTTQEIFASFQKFKEHLQGTFGDIDTERKAERNLKRLRQHKSAQLYASEFLQISSHTSWDDDVLISLFEDGLKPEIQEKLIWMDTPDTLNKFIKQVVKIDNKMYDFNARRRGNQFQRNPRTIIDRTIDDLYNHVVIHIVCSQWSWTQFNNRNDDHSGE